MRYMSNLAISPVSCQLFSWLIMAVITVCGPLISNIKSFYGMGSNIGVVVFSPFPVEFRRYFLLFPDLFRAPGPYLVAFQSEDGHAGSENRPEVFLHGAGEVVEEIKAGEICQLGKAAVTCRAAHHPRQDQDDGGEAVDEERSADHFGGWRLAEEIVNPGREGRKKVEVANRPYAHGDKECYYIKEMT